MTRTYVCVGMLAVLVLVSPLSVRQAAEPTAPPQLQLREVPIPIVRVKGSHYEAGKQLGTLQKEQLMRSVERAKKRPDWPKLRAEAALSLQYTRKYMPEHVMEIQGAADGAGLELEDLFTTLCDEIGTPGYQYTTGCTDVVVTGDVTRDGSVLVAHNNDTGVSTQDDVTIIHWQVDGEPEIVAVGYGGLAISVGYNSAGISLTGNQLNANDARIGVPRMMLVRKILAARRIGEAIDAAVLKQRASNYNQVIADSNGETYSIEGSATDYAPLYAESGYLVHTNHFTAPSMRKFEAEPTALSCSLVRYNRATRLLKKNLGDVTVDHLKEILSDHVNHPESICRHGKSVKTTFSIILNLSTQTMLLAKGNPCEVKYNEYRLIGPAAPSSD
jgi:isopenicillin-N N-acyltransferase like protein